jgi:hypothetical protein
VLIQLLYARTRPSAIEATEFTAATRRGLTGNICHRLLEEKPGPIAVAKLDPTIQLTV